MQKVLLVGAVALMATVSSVAAQQRSSKETPVTITGCVAQGEKSDSFLIRTLTVAGAPASVPAGSWYRFDTTKGLKDHVNHRVEVSGMVDFDDIDSGSVTTATNAAGQSTTTVNTERRNISAVDAPSATAAPAAAATVKTPVNTYKFKVGAIKMLSSTC